MSPPAPDTPKSAATDLAWRILALLNLFRLLTVYLKPVLPRVAAQAEAFLNGGLLDWATRLQPLLGTRIAAYQPLLVRVDPDAISRMVKSSMDTSAKAAAPATPATTSDAAAEIELADFQKVELRIATVMAAEAVEGADKLVRMTLDIGSEQRTVLSGIKSAYAPADLVGRQVILVANLKPRKMRFGVSEGMVLAASGDAGVFLVGPDSGATAGMRVSR